MCNVCFMSCISYEDTQHGNTCHVKNHGLQYSHYVQVEFGSGSPGWCWVQHSIKITSNKMAEEDSRHHLNSDAEFHDVVEHQHQIILHDVNRYVCVICGKIFLPQPPPLINVKEFLAKQKASKAEDKVLGETTVPAPRLQDMRNVIRRMQEANAYDSGINSLVYFSNSDSQNEQNSETGYLPDFSPYPIQYQVGTQHPLDALFTLDDVRTATDMALELMTKENSSSSPNEVHNTNMRMPYNSFPITDPIEEISTTLYPPRQLANEEFQPNYVAQEAWQDLPSQMQSASGAIVTASSYSSSIVDVTDMLSHLSSVPRIQDMGSRDHLGISDVYAGLCSNISESEDEDNLDNEGEINFSHDVSDADSCILSGCDRTEKDDSDVEILSVNDIEDGVHPHNVDDSSCASSDIEVLQVIRNGVPLRTLQEENKKKKYICSDKP